MTSVFKYLRVVPDKATKVNVVDYRLIQSHLGGLDLIIPMNGITPEAAAQKYLYEHKSKTGVYVRRYLPETKYETYVDESHSKDPRKQLELFQKEESQKLSKQKLEIMLKEY